MVGVAGTFTVLLIVLFKLGNKISRLYYFFCSMLVMTIFTNLALLIVQKYPSNIMISSTINNLFNDKEGGNKNSFYLPLLATNLILADEA